MTSLRPDDDPVVVGANWYRFASGERIVNEHVMSVSFVWIVSGGGEILAGGQRFAVDAQHVVRLPWHHRVEYRAHTRGPFHIGTLHVVPRHDRNAPVVPRVAFLPGDPLLEDPARHGDAAQFRPGLSSMRNAAARRITEFGTIAIERLGEGPYDEAYFRALGHLVLAENAAWSRTHTHQALLPGSLELMMTFIRHHVAEPLTVARVAESARCSPATAQRLFTRHTGESMQAWIRQLRLREAATLLRTTGLRVSEVAQLVGYADPLYFSRAFRRAFGVAPSEFARATLRP
ncbi:MAG: helix-turn-helix transcriptional regulator [Microbacterium sp.]|uniref:helix-turn-helix transcriptional regulator n=1 Tax=Microbacterium sp. TaxID=51671 RepID=UPI001AD2CDA6|nr:AraC family transcriptional regulator [Microbacterium sp.]MBN9176530.1 helix-turn-helix transcriptional regulator [Microbacterium sp.]